MLTIGLASDVGNKAAVFPLQLLGFEVDVVNSVHFSNHTGYAQGWEGDVLKGDQLVQILNGLERNELLEDVEHVLTGYIGSESFLEAVLDVLHAVRKHNSHARYVCDPVLGDHGKFYVPENLVQVYKEKLLPVADVITPNQFEVEQLTGIQVDSIESAKKACAALHEMGPNLVFVTSCVFGDSKNNDNNSSSSQTISILASRRQSDGGFEQWNMECPIFPGRFTGTGDLCAALLLAHTARYPDDLAKAMELVSNSMHAVIERTHASYTEGSVKSCELKLIQSRKDIESPQIRFRASRIN